MKSTISKIQQQTNYRPIFMLVALLFLPFAQAQHNDEHDLLDFDFHCQICHSALDIDGDNIAVKPQAVTLQNLYNPLVITTPYLPSNNNKAAYTTRAPPQLITTND